MKVRHITRVRMDQIIGPCILINCPSFKAAPRILVSFETKRLIFASVMTTDDGWVSDDCVDRLSISDAAPYPKEAAKPDQRRQNVTVTRDTISDVPP